jgi:protein SCO1/2
VLAFLLTGAILAFNILRPITVLPRITPAPGYALQDPTGAIVNSEAQRGKLTLYSFTYSECADPCVQSAADIAATRGALATALPSDVTVDFLTISVDPEFDTPQRLAELQAANAGPEADGVPWTFLTSDPLRTRMAVGKGFGVYFAEPKVEPDATRSVTFDPRYVLVDGWGIIRAEYRAARPDPEILERDVNLLVSEARNSSGLVKLGYEAAHLFACYPR